MALGLLCLGLTLLGALQSQAQDTTPTPRGRPDLKKVPLQVDFQEDKFQGTWYIAGMAEDPIQYGNQSKIHSVTYELKDDHSYHMNVTLLSGDACVNWAGYLFPDVYPGQFAANATTLDNETRSYTVKVTATDYNHFAVLFLEDIHGDAVYFKAILYQRTVELTPTVKQYFFIVAEQMNFAKDAVSFPATAESCINN